MQSLDIQCFTRNLPNLNCPLREQFVFLLVCFSYWANKNYWEEQYVFFGSFVRPLDLWNIPQYWLSLVKLIQYLQWPGLCKLQDQDYWRNIMDGFICNTHSLGNFICKFLKITIRTGYLQKKGLHFFLMITYIRQLICRSHLWRIVDILSFNVWCFRDYYNYPLKKSSKYLRTEHLIINRVTHYFL